MKLVKQLLESGANPDIHTHLGDTPSSLAYGSGHMAVAGLLDDAVAKETGEWGVPNTGSISIRPPHPHSETSQGRGGGEGEDDLELPQNT